MTEIELFFQEMYEAAFDAPLCECAECVRRDVSAARDAVWTEMALNAVMLVQMGKAWWN